MSETNTPQPAQRRRGINIDLFDVLGFIGFFAMIAGAAAFHWGLALFTAGACAVIVAYKFSEVVE